MPKLNIKLKNTKENRPKFNDAYVANSLIQAMQEWEENGGTPGEYKRTWVTLSGAVSGHSGEKYTGRNGWLLTFYQMLGGLDSNVWFTKTAARKFGLDFSGLPTFTVFSPPKIKYEKDKSGNFVLDENGNKIPAGPPRWYVYHVLNASHLLSQNEGLDTDGYAKFVERVNELTPSKTDHNGADVDIVALFNTYASLDGIDLRWGGDVAGYDPESHAVALPKPDRFPNLADFARTGLHEFAHSTLKHLDRPFSFDNRSPEYAREEIVARSADVILSVTLGLADDVVAASIAYMAGWMTNLKQDFDDGGSKWQIVSRAIGDAIKAAEYILEKLDGAPIHAPNWPVAHQQEVDA